MKTVGFRFLGISLLLVPVLVEIAAAQPRPREAWGVPRFHDPSTPVRDGGSWYVFSTGNGISTRRSADLKSWTEGEPVFKELPAWHRDIVPDHKGHLWAPDVIRLGGRYLVYYSVSGWGKNTSAIGLASSPTLDPARPDYGWKDEGIVIRSASNDAYNAIDPQLHADKDGRLWMVFGSFWTGIQLIELDTASGLRHPERKEIRQLAWHDSIEAAAILDRHGYYYLFLNWGKCCRGLESTYEIRVGRSREITGPYLDADGKELATGGGTLLAGFGQDEVGPGHPCFIEENGAVRMFFHFYDRKRRGFPNLGSHVLGWTDDHWPRLQASP